MCSHQEVSANQYSQFRSAQCYSIRREGFLYHLGPSWVDRPSHDSKSPALDIFIVKDVLLVLGQMRKMKNEVVVGKIKAMPYPYLADLSPSSFSALELACFVIGPEVAGDALIMSPFRGHDVPVLVEHRGA